jgi:hypothetical protein
MEVRAARGEPWLVRTVPLDCARLDEAINLALASINEGGDIPATGCVRFVFARATVTT